MLRITQSKSAAGAMSYFSEGLTKGDYYATGEDSIGRWGGKAAERLGLSGEVATKDFAALINNQKPDGSKLNPRHSKTRKVGYDFTFSVPKSVSVAYAINKDERILEAFQGAVQSTMQEMEKDMRTQTGQGKEKEHKLTGNMVWASFTHKTSRPVDGIPDPHLHSHCFVMNTTWNEDKKRFQAGEFGMLKKTAPYYETAFNARMANKMKSLGYGIDKRGYSYELSGIDSPTLSKFSRRTAEVEAAAKNKGESLTAKQKDKLGALTRSKKEKKLSWEKLQKVWEGWLSDAESEAIRQAAQPSATFDREKKKDVLVDGALSSATHHLFERKSVVKEYQLKAETLKRSYGDVLPEQLDGAISRQKFYKQKKDYQNYLTTDDALQAENQMLAYMREGKGTKAPINPFYQPKADYLNREQVAAIFHALKDTNNVTIVSGGAGVGKTTLVKEIRDGIEESNIPFIGVAPSAAASRGVMRSEGFKDSDTLARLLVDEEFQQKTNKGVIWVDEAGLIGVKDMNKLFKVAKQQEARILMTGDINQHSSVAAGDALRILEQEGGIKVARVNEIQRQRNSPQFKKIVALAAKGEADKALYDLDKMGGVVELKNQEHRQQALVQSYVLAAKQKKTALIVSPTHREGKQVTTALRHELKELGTLDKQERIFTQLKTTNWTEENKGDIRHYHDHPQKLMVEFHQNSQGHKKGERWNLDAEQSLNLHVLSAQKEGKEEGNSNQLGLRHANRFTVYQKQELQLAKGEKIRITKGGKTREGTRIHNGDTFTIKGFTKQGHIKLHTGKVLDKGFGHLAYGYTTTSHSSQGKTVDRVFIAQSSQSLPAASTEQFYVSISRARERATIFTDDKLALERGVKKSGKRMTAREVVYHQDTVENAIRAKHKRQAKSANAAAVKAKQNQHSKTHSL